MANLLKSICLGLLVLQGLTSGAQSLNRLAGGTIHSLLIKNDGSLWAMGWNASGQLGDGTYGGTLGYTNIPELIVSNGATSVAAGYNFSLFLKDDGSLWAMGYNGDGEYGNGTTNGTKLPEENITNGVLAIAAGQNHSLFIKTNGSLWGMGIDGQGQLGNGKYSAAVLVPEQIVGSNVMTIAAGWYFSLFIESNGSLWAMGDDSYGQLGNGTYDPSGYAGYDRPQEIETNGVIAIAGGALHSLFIKNDGSLWAMGWNQYGQLGDGTFNQTSRPEEIVSNGVAAIAAGNFHSVFLKNDGSLWAMGGNSLGQLGDGTENQTNRPEEIVPNGVVAIAAGEVHTLFLKSDGSLWGMGSDTYGMLGPTNDYNHRPLQIVAGPPGYNQISAQLPSSGNLQMSFVGDAGANYALDRSCNLAQPQWIPQATNPANSSGTVLFTNTPDMTTNNFWRIRFVP